MDCTDYMSSTDAAGHTASDEQIDADKRGHLPQHELGRSERKGLREGAGRTKGHGVEEVFQMIQFPRCSSLNVTQH
jgi:hypothetical protein